MIPYELMQRLLRVEEGTMAARARLADRKATMASLEQGLRTQGANLGGGKFAPPPETPVWDCGARKYPIRDYHIEITRLVSGAPVFSGAMTLVETTSALAWYSGCIANLLTNPYDYRWVFRLMVAKSGPLACALTHRYTQGLGGVCPDPLTSTYSSADFGSIIAFSNSPFLIQYRFTAFDPSESLVITYT